MRRVRIYLAAPLFSLAERSFNKRLVRTLGKELSNVSFILPQEQAAKMSSQEEFSKRVFRYCIDSVGEADAMLCILEGPDVDSGTCIEMGYAYALGKPIIGVRSDFRGSEESGVNVMVARVCQAMVWLPSSRVSYEEVVAEIVAALRHALPSIEC